MKDGLRATVRNGGIDGSSEAGGVWVGLVFAARTSSSACALHHEKVSPQYLKRTVGLGVVSLTFVSE